MWYLSFLQLLLVWHAVAAENATEAGQLSMLPYVLRMPATRPHDRQYTLLKTHSNSGEVLQGDSVDSELPANQSQATPWERMAQHMPFDLIKAWHAPGFGYSQHSQNSSPAVPALLGVVHFGILCYVLLGILGLLQRLLVLMPSGGADRLYYGGTLRGNDYTSNEFFVERDGSLF